MLEKSISDIFVLLYSLLKSTNVLLKIKQKKVKKLSENLRNCKLIKIVNPKTSCFYVQALSFLHYHLESFFPSMED